MLNNGTREGDEYEIKFVNFFNLNKHIFRNYYDDLQVNITNHYLVRVTTKQYSQLSSKKVMTRADAYLARFSSEININLNNVDENILEELKIKYNAVDNSGISIKSVGSTKYQILKLTPESFFNLFGDYELGAGASIYCDNVNEFYKNDQLLNGWHTDRTKLYSRFGLHTVHQYDVASLRYIKKMANEQIKNIIYSSEKLQKMIFNGIGLYKEPYTAHYFYNGGNLEKLKLIPFTITTGSGRSKGNYTIVLKPSC